MAKKNETTESGKLFNGYGEVDSAEELNEVAAGFKNEGDIDSLRTFAKENGFEDADVDTYLNGGEFCNIITAALAKMKVEANDSPGLVHLSGLLGSELDDLELAVAIRKKGKRLKDAMKMIEAKARDTKQGNVGIVSDMEGLMIAKKYYMGGNGNAKA